MRLLPDGAPSRQASDGAQAELPAGCDDRRGRDLIGPFLIRGRYQVDDGQCWWTKRYIGKHDVSYRGYNEGKGIWGLWEILRPGRGASTSGPRPWATRRSRRLSEAIDEPNEIVTRRPAWRSARAWRLVPGRAFSASAAGLGPALERVRPGSPWGGPRGCAAAHAPVRDAVPGLGPAAVWTRFTMVMVLPVVEGDLVHDVRISRSPRPPMRARSPGSTGWLSREVSKPGPSSPMTNVAARPSRCTTTRIWRDA